MVISFYKDREKLYVKLSKDQIKGEIADALFVIGFIKLQEDKFVIDLDRKNLGEKNDFILRLKSYLDNKNYPYELDENSKSIFNSVEENKKSFKSIENIANTLLEEKYVETRDLFSQDFKRELKEFQKDSVAHFIKVPFAANFSVPGSGKTTLVYAAYSKLKEIGEVDKILVIGPSSIYLAWQEEFYQCFGKEPNLIRIVGELNKRKQIYEEGGNFEVFILTYQMLSNDYNYIKELLKKHNFLVVLDESHYIKNFREGKWASAVLEIAPYSKRRIILTGTPIPNNLFDLWSQFTFLDPAENILGNKSKYKKIVEEYDLDLLRKKLSPYYRRIKKGDLNLPPPKFHTIKVSPKPLQKRIYNLIRKKILADTDYNIREKKYLREVQKARIVRLMQVASNPKLISEKSEEFDILPLGEQENLRDLDNKIKEIIKEHQEENSAKIEYAEKLTRSLVEKEKKVLIWTPWISNIKLLADQLKDLNPVTIWGDIPINEEIDKDDNREYRINEFKNNPDVKVLIANPGACGESISLHNVCHDAIYLDRTFNGAQFMQSMDRIHRVGLKENIETNYYLLLTEDTIDYTINNRLNDKIAKMYEILKDEFSSLDLMSSLKNITDIKDDEELDYAHVLKDLKEIKND